MIQIKRKTAQCIKVPTIRVVQGTTKPQVLLSGTLSESKMTQIPRLLKEIIKASSPKVQTRGILRWKTSFTLHLQSRCRRFDSQRKQGVKKKKRRFNFHREQNIR